MQVQHKSKTISIFSPYNNSELKYQQIIAVNRNVYMNMQVLTKTKLYTTMINIIIVDILAANIHDAASCIEICKTVKELCQCVIDLRIPKSTMYFTFTLSRYPKASSQIGLLDPFDNTIKVCFLISPYKKQQLQTQSFDAAGLKQTLEKTEGANQEQTIQRNIGYTRHKMKTGKTKNTTQKTQKDEEHRPPKKPGVTTQELDYGN